MWTLFDCGVSSATTFHAKGHRRRWVFFFCSSENSFGRWTIVETKRNARICYSILTFPASFDVETAAECITALIDIRSLYSLNFVLVFLFFSVFVFVFSRNERRIFLSNIFNWWRKVMKNIFDHEIMNNEKGKAESTWNYSLLGRMKVRNFGSSIVRRLLIRSPLIRVCKWTLAYDKFHS